MKVSYVSCNPHHCPSDFPLHFVVHCLGVYFVLQRMLLSSIASHPDFVDARTEVWDDWRGNSSKSDDHLG
jgi:hypothetical protein